MLSFVLILSLMLSFFSTTAMAISDDKTTSLNPVETYTSMELGGIMTRTIEDNKVTVTWTPFDKESEPFTIIRDDGGLYLDAAAISVGSAIAPFMVASSDFDNVNWGDWQTFSERVETGGKKTALVAAIISAAAPWMALRVITAAITVAASSDYYIIEGRIRYGMDEKKEYLFYERETSIIDDRGKAIIENYVDRGRERQ